MTEEQKILDIFVWNYAPTITGYMDDAELDAISDEMAAGADNMGEPFPLGVATRLQEMRDNARRRQNQERRTRV